MVIRINFLGIVLSIIAVLPVITVFDSQAEESGQPDIRIESQPGTVIFSHSRHNGILCQDCHHETQTSRIEFSCRACHIKSADNVVNTKQAFHKSCIGCHLSGKKNNKKTGPAKLCSQCHMRKK